MRVCHPVILASAGTASFCLIIAAESHDKAWGTKKYIYIKHQQKNTQTTGSDHCPGFSCCILTTQTCGCNPVFYRYFSSVNKTPKHKPRLKNHQNQKALLPEVASDSSCLCVSSCCLHAAKATASLASVGLAPDCKGLRGALRHRMGGSPSGVCPVFPSPPPQQPRAPRLLPRHWCAPRERGACSGQVLLGVNGIPVPSEIRFLHRYFCSKTKLGTRDVQLVTKPPFKTWAGWNNT